MRYRYIGLDDLHLGNSPHLFTQKKAQDANFQDSQLPRNWGTSSKIETNQNKELEKMILRFCIARARRLKFWPLILP